MDGLSAFDGIALVILLGSGLMALVRGFVREALSVTAFVAAALASLWARPVFIGLGREFIPNDLIANIAVLGVVFVLVFLAVSFVTGSLTKRTKEGEDVGVVDRALGFVFGLRAQFLERPQKAAAGGQFFYLIYPGHTATAHKADNAVLAVQYSTYG